MKLAVTAAFLIAGVQGHASVTNPRQRGDNSYCNHCTGISQVATNPGGPDDIPGTVPYTEGICGSYGGENYNFPGTEDNYGAGNPPYGYEPVATYESGATFDVNIFWSAAHGGWHQFRVCPNATINSWFMQEGSAPTADQQNTAEACFAANPVKMNACDDNGKGNGWCWLGESGSPSSQSITLPAGFACEHCLLSWRWDAYRSANEVYTQCSDISVTGGSAPEPEQPEEGNPACPGGDLAGCIATCPTAAYEICVNECVNRC